ncbi:HopJ type III effector protein [Jiulongibacter sediminis]|uniref:HopJ type III effector protein n=1 Tax=Jiulongibacter sediminis TaxID=1605367 RepID=UPI0026F09A80|nr:HopJ type III effector protein [Jiulongibacter sediminis]
MNLEEFLSKINEEPARVSFADTLDAIEANYTFKPTAFKNGDTYNEAGQNNGSCKIFAFAQKHQLTAEQTLYCFGTYYRNDVLNNPDGDDHQNIRNFIKYGWDGIEFEGEALV